MIEIASILQGTYKKINKIAKFYIRENNMLLYISDGGKLITCFQLEGYHRGCNQKDSQNLRVAKTPTTKTISRIAVFISVTCPCRFRAYTGVAY